MKIKAKCRAHPEAPVYMLDGTISASGEKTHNTTVYLDEANCYCTSTDEEKKHDIYFETQEVWRDNADCVLQVDIRLPRLSIASYSLQEAAEEAIRTFRHKYARAPIYENVNIIVEYSATEVILTFTETS